MSDTPETDANLWDHGDEIDPSMRPDSSGDWVPKGFARKLEHERDEARADLQTTQGAWVKAKVERVEAFRERDEAKQQERIHYDNFLSMQNERDQWRKCAESLAYVLNGQVPWPPSMDKHREYAFAEFERLKEGGK